jgi:hypothetical protein
MPVVQECGESVENLLNKRARIDTSTTILGWEGEEGILRGRDRKIAVGTRTTISTYTSSAAIKDGGSMWVISPHAPVVVLD